jgi:UDP:flavonoid glycosyltransferase YjiC (YdhE family)
MRILLSTIGSRGDVQPLVALAMQLRGLARAG